VNVVVVKGELGREKKKGRRRASLRKKGFRRGEILGKKISKKKLCDGDLSSDWTGPVGSEARAYVIGCSPSMPTTCSTVV